ncbi:GHKL domain-containing protein [Listeria booriae]|uniref:GHKL domain-containing protein n=1 Tax=Listeria booriae TaxID=1552123 RepID=UPI001C8BD6FB|nr:GHKL domain-containing protein [Listeria booriae]
MKASLLLLLLRGIIGISWYLSYDLIPFFGNISLNEYTPIFSILFFFTLFFTLIIIGILYILNNKHSIFFVILDNSKDYFLWGYYILGGFIFFEILFYITLKNSHLNSLYSASYLFFYIFIVLTITTIFIQERTKNLEKEIILTNLQYDKEKLFALEEFHHDYKAFIFSLTQYIENNDNQQALNFIKKENEYINKLLPNPSIMNIKNLEITPLQGLLINHLKRFESGGIHYLLSIPQKIKYIEMDIIDIIRVLNIAIDNAYETSLNVKNAQISIVITQYENLILIDISNKIPLDNIPDLGKITNRNYSTKSGSSRGKGMYILSKIVSNYNNVNYEIFIHEESELHIILSISN